MLGNILSNKGADIFSESVVNEIIAQPMDHAYENAPASISRSYLMNLYKFYQEETVPSSTCHPFRFKVRFMAAICYKQAP